MHLKKQIDIVRTPGQKFSYKAHKVFMDEPILSYLMLSFLKFDTEFGISTLKKEGTETEKLHHSKMMTREAELIAKQATECLQDKMT